MVNSKYKRALLKLSGEALKGDKSYGIDPKAIRYVATQIKNATLLGVELAVVVGGGNIWRGAEAELDGMDRGTADHAGMLATMINGLALQDALEKIGVNTRTQTALSIQAVAESYIRRRAIRHLEKGRVVILAAGTGNTYVTTDTAAALRSVDLGAELLLMGKNKVDGVYDSDPNIKMDAKKFDFLTYQDAFARRLKIMDSAALAVCMENNLPIVVFDLFEANSLEKVLVNEQLGTLIADSSNRLLNL
jgi:uridylate kinase